MARGSASSRKDDKFRFVFFSPFHKLATYAFEKSWLSAITRWITITELLFLKYLTKICRYIGNRVVFIIASFQPVFKHKVLLYILYIIYSIVNHGGKIRISAFLYVSNYANVFVIRIYECVCVCVFQEKNSEGLILYNENLYVGPVQGIFIHMIRRENNFFFLLQSERIHVFLRG